jgi:hypothetical protein
MDKVEEWRKAYIQAINDMIKANEKLTGIENNELAESPEPEPVKEPAKEPEKPAETPAPAKNSGYGETLSWTGSGANRVWRDSNGNTYAYGSAEQKAIQKAFDKAYAANGGYKGKYFLGWNTLSVEELEKYGLATGGYTGSWGPEGKLAFLHEKELVLNQDDTINLLKTVGFIREIIGMIDS